MMDDGPHVGTGIIHRGMNEPLGVRLAASRIDRGAVKGELHQIVDVDAFGGPCAREKIAVRPVRRANAHMPERIDHAFAREDAVRRHQFVESLRRCHGAGLWSKMNGMTKRLKTVLLTRGHTQALKDGSVKPRTFELDFEDVPDVPMLIKAFRRMVRGLEFDICEMAMTTYLCARDHGKAFTAIPVFPMRAFHHGAILYNTKAGIRTPKDLEGRKVGVNRGYTVTTGLWARSILQHEYSVDLSRVTWVLSGDEHVAEYRPPPNVVPIEPGKTMEEMLIAGEIAAAIGVDVKSADVKPLIPNAREAGFEALRQRGHYPINHTVVVRNDRLDAHPDLAPDIFSAFAEAKRLYLQGLREGRVDAASPTDQVFRRVMEITGDPLPYGIDANRQALEAIVQHSVEQGILSRAVAIEELFPHNTRTLTA